jgi:heat-inducible transcriptional repressor
MMVIISIQSLFVKTIVMELHNDVSRQEIDEMVDILNERLSGLTLEKIKSSIAIRLADCKADRSLLNVIIGAAGELFDESSILERLYISGTEYIVDQPEFNQPQKVRELITMIEDKFRIATLVDDISHVSDSSSSGRDVVISIGKENSELRAEDLTIVSIPYYVGNMVGKLGILGPKRMDYERAVRVVNYMADRLSTTLS